jgi:Tripartite tricarboxylate transporter family receptor
MLDNPEKTARLLAALKEAVPFKVELVPSLVNYLRTQHIAIADQTQHIVSGLSYAGDEGGIVCHIVRPYRGAAPAMQDLVAGQIDLMFDQAGNTLQQLRNGKIKAFAVAATKRLALAPDIPTMDEAGVPGFYLSVWHGMWAPKGTPKDVIAKLNSAIVTALAQLAHRRIRPAWKICLPAGLRMVGQHRHGGRSQYLLPPRGPADPPFVAHPGRE